MAGKDPTGLPDDDLDDLYAAPLDSFVAKREELAKRLRADGHRELAEQAKRLRKPSLPAWAINKGVRAARPTAKKLMDAGAELAKARSGDQLRAATTAFGEAVEAMLDEVAAAAGGSKLSAAMLDRVRETLRALASDAELRQEFAAGRVSEDHQLVGFAPAAVSAGAPPKRASKPRQTKAGATRVREAQSRERRAAKAAAAAAKRAAQATKRMERAEEAVEAAGAKLREAEDDERSSAVELADARRALAELKGK